METVFGWPLYLSSSPNKRTLYNFPMQGNGAEMLRLAAWRLCEAGIVPSMLVHDGLLIEVQNEEQIAHAMEIMRIAGRDVCNGLEIGVDVDQVLKAGARYRDKRPVARTCGHTMMCTLQDVGAMPQEGAAVNYVMRHGRRIEIETIETGTSSPKKRKPFKAQWVKFPLRWVESLQRSKSVSTYQLALAILFEAFKHNGGEIILSSTVTRMPRSTKMRAVRELVELGLIEIKQRGNQAVRVSILSTKEQE